MDVLQAITLIPIVDDLSLIKQQINIKLKIQQWKKKKIYYEQAIETKSLPNQKTQDLTWFDNVPTSMGRREIFIENREENNKIYKKISLTQLSMVEIWNSLELLTLLDSPSKGHP